MNLFDNILLDIIILIFPLILCILYNRYNKIYGLKKNNLFEDFAILTSYYFILKFNNDSISLYLLMNLPLILAYLKDKTNSILIISISCCLILSLHYHSLFILFIIEYITYYLIYIIFKNKHKTFFNIFIYLKILFYILYKIVINTSFTINTLIVIGSFIFVSYIVIVLFYKINNILKFENNIKELEEEKNLRLSLFKITHEIKNPITVCKGYLDMFDSSNIEKSKKYVNILKGEIDRVLVLLEDFLSINKIKIEKDIIDLNLLLEETTNNFIPILKEKNIHRCFNISKEELYIDADYNRLKQVLINIIKNSIESINSDGLIKLYSVQKKDSIEIHIEDNGIGMNKEELLKIKEPFFSTKSKGTGLGVYLSNQIIKAHNGTIEYESKENIGTNTIIILPYKEMVF